jgi:transcriptional repressor NF-X1
VTTSLLASQLAAVQAGNSVNLGQRGSKDARLECTEECHQIERNKRVSLALQIRNPELSSKVQPRYSEFMKDWAKKDPNLCSLIHTKLTELVKLSKDSKQRSRAYSFDCMNREKRQLVHEFAEHFGCESESFDAEPKRNVVATALRDKSWLPALSLLEFVAKQKRALPGPVSSGLPIKPTFTSLSIPTGKAGEVAELHQKIDWFD